MMTEQFSWPTFHSQNDLQGRRRRIFLYGNVNSYDTSGRSRLEVHLTSSRGRFNWFWAINRHFFFVICLLLQWHIRKSFASRGKEKRGLSVQFCNPIKVKEMVGWNLPKPLRAQFLKLLLVCSEATFHFLTTQLNWMETPPGPLIKLSKVFEVQKCSICLWTLPVWYIQISKGASSLKKSKNRV